MPAAVKLTVDSPEADLAAAIQAIANENCDEELKASDYRHLLEEQMGLPHDGLVQRKDDIMKIIKFGVVVPAGRSKREWIAILCAVCIMMVAIALVEGSPLGFIHEPKEVGVYLLKACVSGQALLKLSELTHGFYMKRIQKVPLSSRHDWHSDELYALLYPSSCEAHRVRGRIARAAKEKTK